MGIAPPAAASGTSPGYERFLDTSRPWWKNRRLVVLNAWIALVLLTSSTSGYDGSMMNGLQSLNTWKSAFGNPTGGKLGLLNAIQNIGSLAAFPFAPLVVDTFGRRPAIVLGTALMLVATALQTASWNVGVFIGARFLIGFGIVFANSASPLLITEVAYPAHRAQATALYNTLWYLGSIVAAWTTYGTFRIHSSWSWRIPSLLQGLPSALQIGLVLFAPESPRWLISKGRDTEALKTLAYYHANGNDQDPLVQFEFTEIKAALRADAAVPGSNWDAWKSLVATPGNRKRMRIIVGLAVFTQWSGNGLVSYYLNKVFTDIGITDPNTQLLLNGVLSIFNFGVAVAAGLLCERLGRRRLFLVSTFGMLLFWSMQTMCFSLYSQFHSLAAGHAVVVMVFLHFACYDMAYCPLVVSYTVEILPYALRAKGFAVFNFVISLSLIFNQYVNPIALDAIGWKYYLVYVGWLAFESLFVFLFIVETKNRTLEETAALFDGPESVARIAEKAAERTHSEEDKPSIEEDEKSPVQA